MKQANFFYKKLKQNLSSGLIKVMESPCGWSSIFVDEFKVLLTPFFT